MGYYTCLWLYLVALSAVSSMDYSSYPEVLRFQEYIRINTTTGNDLQPAVDFWKKLAAAQNVTIKELQLVGGCPILILAWPGTDPTLQSIMLNSHMDVVPANEADGWTRPPFSADITSDGLIWGRGTQDMKSVSLQYYEALSRMKARGEKLARNVYMTLMPDEEVGGVCGMVPFVKSAEFASLNVTFALDEGGASPQPMIPLLYHDKAVWQIRVDCYGVAAHGSTMPPLNTTAIGKCLKVTKTLLRFRQKQYKISLKAPVTDASSFTSVNLDIVNAGTANNVIPGHMSLIFDIRLAYNVNEEIFAKKLSEWVTGAGDNVTLTYILQNAQTPATVINSSNPFFTAIVDVGKNFNVTVVPFVPSGATDSRFVRAVGIPAFGLSPMPNVVLLAHAVNEHMPVQTFMNGIPIYEAFIKSIANLPESVVGTNPSVYVRYTNGKYNVSDYVLD